MSLLALNLDLKHRSFLLLFKIKMKDHGGEMSGLNMYIANIEASILISMSMNYHFFHLYYFSTVHINEFLTVKF